MIGGTGGRVGGERVGGERVKLEWGPLCMCATTSQLASLQQCVCCLMGLACKGAVHFDVHSLRTLCTLCTLCTPHQRTHPHIVGVRVAIVLCMSARERKVHQPVSSTLLAIHAHYYFWDALVCRYMQRAMAAVSITLHPIPVRQSSAEPHGVLPSQWAFPSPARQPN